MRSQRQPRLAVVVVAGAVLALIVAPSSATAAPRKGWVASVPRTSAFVGVVVRANAVTAYVCDGRRVGRWYSGRLREASARLEDRRGREMIVRIRGSRLTGSLRLGDRRVRFVAAPASGKAGLFRRERTRTRTRAGRAPVVMLEGWIRLNDGRVKGAVSKQPLRVRRPRSDIEVLLEPTQERVEGADGAPPQSARLSTAAHPCVDRPGFRIGGREIGPVRAGPTCGLALAGVTRRTQRGARISERPARFPLTDAGFDRLLSDLPRRLRLERERLLRAAEVTGLAPGLSAMLRLRIAAQLEAMKADKRLTAAADALRNAKDTTPASLVTVYEQRAAEYLVPDAELFDLPERVVRQVPVTGTTHFRHVQQLTGPWAVFDFSSTDGFDAIASADITGGEGPNVICDIVCVRSHVDVEWGSEAEYEQYAILDLDTPPGASEVEIEIDYRHRPETFAYQTCPGTIAYAETDLLTMLHAIEADGTYHVFDGDPVDSLVRLNYTDRVNLPGTCNYTPPILPPPLTTIIGTTTLRIPDPPAAGAHYLLTVASRSNAHVDLGGRAYAFDFVTVDGVTMRSN